MKTKIWNIFNFFRSLPLKRNKGLEIGKNTIVSGKPLIIAKNGSKISIGDRVTLNSNNKKYVMNMHSPVKLVTDSPDAYITIGDDTRINGASIYARKSVVIGERCLIAANTNILDSNGHDLSFEDVSNRYKTRGSNASIVIEDDVWIGANCTILPGVHIGKGSVIGTGSIVTKDIPEMVFAVGAPAKVIKNYTQQSEHKEG